MTVETKQGRRIDWILIGIAVLSAFLNIYKIWDDQYGNPYYTAAVTSMLQSFHNFFFASFDPGGFVTIDKPPVVFWIQTLFAYIFGVHGWSVILPQALADVGSVFLIYFLVKPVFGQTAARLASLVMACTPVAVAVSRTNNIDGMLVFALLLATWMLLKGIRNQKLSWLLGSFAMIGVGFNMKMLEAYLALPAFYFFYLIAFKHGWKKKLAILAAATVILVGVSFSWAVVVDSIPQQDRPYVGSSHTNSVLELAFGYNGVSRLTGNRHMWQNGGAIPGQRQFGDGNSASNRQQMMQNGNHVPGGFGPNGNGRLRQMFGRRGGGMFGAGQPGPLRLFQNELSGQISWLLPFVAFACVGLLAGIGRRKPLTAKQQETLFWLAWLLPGMVFFSIAGFIHQYYLVTLAPPIAALAGAGWVELWNHYRNNAGWKTWLLPLGILATTAFELYVLYPYQQQIGIGWSVVIGAAGIGSSLVLFFASSKQKLSSIVAMAGMLALLVAPLYWATTPILYGDNGSSPQAGPIQLRFGPGTGMMAGGRHFGTVARMMDQRQFVARWGMRGRLDSKLLQYVTKHNTGEKYLFATTNAITAAPYIIKTGKPVMAMGGFSGSDPILTVEKLKQLVKNKEVKFFLIPSDSGFGGRGFGGFGNSEVLNWIRAHGKQVPKSQWQSNTAQGDHGGPMGMEGENNALYVVTE